MNRFVILSVVCCLSSLVAIEAAPADREELAKSLRSAFSAPAKFTKDFGAYRSPLLFADGTSVKTAADWQRRRLEILKDWNDLMGSWPPVIEKPKIEFGAQEKRDRMMQHRIRVEVAPGVMADDCYLLVPDGKGPFPAVVVVFYDAATGIGRGKPTTMADYGYHLAKRGFVALSIGGPPAYSGQEKKAVPLQPLSYNAYVAANCYQALANMPTVDAKRIGVVGLSYGGKWAMFASCLYEKFACAVWSDPGIVFDEKRGNVNYWEPWYLGFEEGLKRKEGIPNDQNPRTGPYKQMIATGRDLHELHALMAPRPFLVSGGSEDQPERWKALNHTVAVNAILGFRDRVAMTNRPGHLPTPEANEQVYRFFEYFLKYGNELEKP